jgi:hypothetical protein
MAGCGWLWLAMAHWLWLTGLLIVGWVGGWVTGWLAGWLATCCELWLADSQAGCDMLVLHAWHFLAVAGLDWFC